MQQQKHAKTIDHRTTTATLVHSMTTAARFDAKTLEDCVMTHTGTCFMHPHTMHLAQKSKEIFYQFLRKKTHYIRFLLSSPTWPWQKQTVRIRTLAVAFALIRITVIVNCGGSLLYSVYPNMIQQKCIMQYCVEGQSVSTL